MRRARSPEQRPSSSTDDDGLLHQQRTGVCRRRFAKRSRDVDVVYTDLFLNGFEYERDWHRLWYGLLDMGDVDDGRRVLIVFSQPIYYTVRRNENACVLQDGRCFIATPETFDRMGGDENGPPIPDMFDVIVYFNVDPFVYAARRPVTTSSSGSTSVLSISRPFVAAAFDRYMLAQEAAIDHAAAVYLVYNVFLLSVDRVEQYERSNDLRVNFRPRVFPVHSFDQRVLCRTACNFCSDDATSCLVGTDNVYSIASEEQIPTLRALGPVMAESMSHPDWLVLLDVGGGGRGHVVEYNRLKLFYFSFAHGRNNKWGVRPAPGEQLRTHIRRWNALLQEEVKRWHWVLRREAVGLSPDVRPSEEELRLRTLQVYAMAPYVLNATDIDRDVCRGTREQVGGLQRHSDYSQNVLSPKYDTTTFGPGGDLTDRIVVEHLLASEISVNAELVVTTGWPVDSSLRTKHNRYYAEAIILN